MKTIKEQVNELLELFGKPIPTKFKNDFKNVIKYNAILSVEREIKMLEEIQDKNTKEDIDNYHITMKILEQTEILTKLRDIDYE